MKLIQFDLLSIVECRDIARATGCKYWASIGDCAKSPEYMTQYCLKSCSNCKVDDTTGTKQIKIYIIKYNTYYL